MVSLGKRQSVADFQKNASKTLDRLNAKGNGHLLTVDGEAKGVLLSMAAYEELEKEALFAQDVEAISQSGREIAAGDVMEAGEFFRQLHAEALELQAKQQRRGSRSRRK